MNRRAFIQTLIGSTFTALTFQVRAFGNSPKWLDGRWNKLSPEEIRDLLLWAPYEPFSPDDTHPTLSDPDDGTETGVLKAADILKGQALTLDYWHGHGGVNHRFTITVDHLNSLKSGNPVVIDLPTTVVEDHYHMVVIDPNRPA